MSQSNEGAIVPEEDLDEDLSDEYEPEPYTGGFIGCLDFVEEDLWED